MTGLYHQVRITEKPLQKGKSYTVLFSLAFANRLNAQPLSTFVCIVHGEFKIHIIQKMSLSNFSLKLQAQYASSNNEVILSGKLVETGTDSQKKCKFFELYRILLSGFWI